MTNHSVILDANVLYPAPLRSILMYLATTGMFRVKWTLEIHDEWIRNLLSNRNELSKESLLYQRDLMIRAIPDSLVTDYQSLVDGLSLPDSDDRHVLAAAIKSKSDIIVTANLKDFPDNVLSEYGCIARHPDDFIMDLIDIDPDLALSIFNKDRHHYLRPPYTVDEYLAILKKQGLIKTSKRLSSHISSI